MSGQASQERLTESEQGNVTSIDNEGLSRLAPYIGSARRSWIN